MRRTIALALVGGVAGILGGCHWFWRDCEPSPCGNSPRERVTVQRSSSDNWSSSNGGSRSGGRSDYYNSNDGGSRSGGRSDYYYSNDGGSRSGSRSEYYRSNDRGSRSESGSDSGTTTPGRVETNRPKGNNGVGNGLDPQPPGNPPQNDGPGTSPGNPGNKKLKAKEKS